MAPISTTTATVAMPRKLMNRSRWFGLIYFILGALVIYVAVTAVDPDVASRFRFGTISRDFIDRLPETVQTSLRQGVPFPTQTSLVIIGMLLLIAGAMPFILPPHIAKRYDNLSLALVFFLLITAVLVYAAAGKRTDLVSMLADGIRLATPIALGAMAGILCERSGVINIGIEGMMLTAAAIGFTASLYLQNSSLGLLFAVLSAMLMAALLAVLAINFNVDQIIAGTVVNILAVGITGFTRRAFLLQNPFGAPSVFPVINIPVLSDLPIIGPVLFQNQPIVFIMLISVFVLQFYLFRTKFGLRHRSVGENPRAADTLGIKVIRTRYLAVLAGGALAGLGGAWFSLETVGSFTDLMTGGKGFIALAAMIFGNWNPIGAFFGALLFGFADALQIKLQILETGIPYQFIGMLPYVLTMIVLAGVIGKTTPPAADGVPYTKD